MKLAAIASNLGGRKRELLVIDDDGGFQGDTIEELKEFMGVE